MKIIIFQGNYPKEYQNTRHNIGFAFADYISNSLNISWKDKPKFKAQIAEFTHGSEKIILVKPLTFYNDTGKTARALCDFYKINWKNDLLVIHDDLDLDFKTIRTRNKGSSAGNNGLKSIISNLNDEFPRIKIGIKNQYLQRIGAMNFVLEKFSKEEAQELDDIFKVCEKMLYKFINNNLKSTKETI